LYESVIKYQDLIVFEISKIDPNYWITITFSIKRITIVWSLKFIYCKINHEQKILMSFCGNSFTFHLNVVNFISIAPTPLINFVESDKHKKQFKFSNDLQV